jgi:hypothetical protein
VRCEAAETLIIMPVLNHHIVAAGDSEASASFYSEVLGLEPAKKLGHFAVLRVSAEPSSSAAYPQNIH